MSAAARHATTAVRVRINVSRCNSTARMQSLSASIGSVWSPEAFHAVRSREIIGSKKSPPPKDGSNNLRRCRGRSGTYPARSRMKFTTSRRVKIAPRSSMPPALANNSTAAVIGQESRSEGWRRWRFRFIQIGQRSINSVSARFSMLTLFTPVGYDSPANSKNFPNPLPRLDRQRHCERQRTRAFGDHSRLVRRQSYRVEGFIEADNNGLAIVF